MVKVENIADVQNIRSRLSELDARFVCAGLKFYLSLDPIDCSKDSVDQLRISKNNVLIETLPAGSLGLPRLPKPVLVQQGVPVLHPSILVLTKLKRWAANADSTRPKTVNKNFTDATDIRFMIGWLARNDLKIDLDQYSGKTKDDFIPLLRQFRNRFADDDENLVAKLKESLTDDDWKSLNE